eukprot:scaffold52539_cov15-Tisochrysis_lutea.AAC.2
MLRCMQAVFHIRNWDLALLAGAGGAGRDILGSMVLRKLQEVFGATFVQMTLQNGAVAAAWSSV